MDSNSRPLLNEESDGNELLSHTPGDDEMILHQENSDQVSCFVDTLNSPRSPSIQSLPSPPPPSPSRDDQVKEVVESSDIQLDTESCEKNHEQENLSFEFENALNKKFLSLSYQSKLELLEKIVNPVQSSKPLGKEGKHVENYKRPHSSQSYFHHREVKPKNETQWFKSIRESRFYVDECLKESSGRSLIKPRKTDGIYKLHSLDYASNVLSFKRISITGDFDSSLFHCFLFYTNDWNHRSDMYNMNAGMVLRENVINCICRTCFGMELQELILAYSNTLASDNSFRNIIDFMPQWKYIIKEEEEDGANYERSSESDWDGLNHVIEGDSDATSSDGDDTSVSDDLFLNIKRDVLGLEEIKEMDGGQQSKESYKDSILKKFINCCGGVYNLNPTLKNNYHGGSKHYKQPHQNTLHAVKSKRSACFKIDANSVVSENTLNRKKIANLIASEWNQIQNNGEYGSWDFCANLAENLINATIPGANLNHVLVLRALCEISGIPICVYHIEPERKSMVIWRMFEPREQNPAVMFGLYLIKHFDRYDILIPSSNPVLNNEKINSLKCTWKLNKEILDSREIFITNPVVKTIPKESKKSGERNEILDKRQDSNTSREKSLIKEDEPKIAETMVLAKEESLVKCNDVPHEDNEEKSVGVEDKPSEVPREVNANAEDLRYFKHKYGEYDILWVSLKEVLKGYKGRMEFFLDYNQMLKAKGGKKKNHVKLSGFRKRFGLGKLYDSNNDKHNTIMSDVMDAFGTAKSIGNILFSEGASFIKTKGSYDFSIKPSKNRVHDDFAYKMRYNEVNGIEIIKMESFIEVLRWKFVSQGERDDFFKIMPDLLTKTTSSSSSSSPDTSKDASETELSNSDSENSTEVEDPVKTLKLDNLGKFKIKRQQPDEVNLIYHATIDQMSILKINVIDARSGKSEDMSNSFKKLMNEEHKYFVLGILFDWDVFKDSFSSSSKKVADEKDLVIPRKYIDSDIESETTLGEIKKRFEKSTQCDDLMDHILSFYYTTDVYFVNLNHLEFKSLSKHRNSPTMLNKFMGVFTEEFDSYSVQISARVPFECIAAVIWTSSPLNKYHHDGKVTGSDYTMLPDIRCIGFKPQNTNTPLMATLGDIWKTHEDIDGVDHYEPNGNLYILITHPRKTPNQYVKEHKKKDGRMTRKRRDDTYNTLVGDNYNSGYSDINTTDNRGVEIYGSSSSSSDSFSDSFSKVTIGYDKECLRTIKWNWYLTQLYLSLKDRQFNNNN